MNDKIKQALTAPRSRRQIVVKPKDLLSTGSTLLNLACSDHVGGGIPKGKYVFFVGDSSSGKTFLALTCFAEAAINRRFDAYRLIYDNVEDGALMDLGRFFGSGVAERLESPGADDVCSTTIEEFYANLDDAFIEDKPFVYVLDSMDSLSSDYDAKKFDEKKAETRGGKEAKGDFGDGKAKINSRYLRKVMDKLKTSGSILIVICQTRDNVGGGLFDPRKIRAGGHALKFYAALEIWTAVAGHITREIKKKKRELGIFAKVAVKKNRVNGKCRTVTVPIYHSVGIDDIGSCVDYLVDEKRWKKEGSKIKAVDFKVEKAREPLIKMIEDEGLEKDLRELVQVVWNEIEAACEVQRKPRYG